MTDRSGSESEDRGASASRQRAAPSHPADDSRPIGPQPTAQEPDSPRIVLEGFEDGEPTERAVGLLEDAGFRPEVIHVE